ncbi:MAG: A/G-specific adenine glycosylase [Thermodesulfobacteriota bacterium]
MDREPSRGTKELTPDVVRAFQKLIYHYYQEHGRIFPWRMTHNPYHILVSEIMLQQTQTERVVGKYELFINCFPDLSSLAEAPLGEILRVWQGLGYNRRTIALKRIAQTVMTRFHGNLPSSPKALMNLPGIGRATASAICAFAFNQPVVFIETNIRRVFIHHFFQNGNSINDTEILPLVEKTLDTSNPRKWYFALMDYGVMVKKESQNPNRRSAHYQKQSPFEDSNRQIRGMILKALIMESDISERQIVQRLEMNPKRVKRNLIQLQKEGFIIKKGNRFMIA